jgi:hypothetical protein
MALRDHLRPDEDGVLGAREPLERLPQLLGLSDSVGVEPDPLELGDVPLELPLEPLWPRSDPGELGRAALRARVRGGLARAAVVAAQRPIPMQRERDVAVRTAAGDAAGATVERGRDAAAVEEEDRLPASLREPAELGEQRGR